MSRSSHRSNIPPMPGRGDASAGPPAVPPHRAIIERFLLEACRAGAIDDATRERLLRFMDAAPAPAQARVPPTPVPTPVTPTPTVPITRVPAPHRPTSQRAAPPSPTRPSATAAWLARARAALVSDLTVHGLAYLGVFLVLAGTLGFFIFSFGSMSESIRPWAELAIPSVLFGSALFLRGRGAPVVATALGLIGGLLLPVVLFASYVDSVGFPPDFSDAALGWAVIVTSLVLAGAYAALAAWRPELSTRFLVAPMVWVALFGVGMLLAPPNRATFRSWTAAQGALVALGVAGTAVVCAIRPRAAFARDASVSVIPGAVVAVLLTLVLPGVSATNWWPYVVTGLATILTAEAVADRLDRAVVQVVQSLAMGLALYGLWLGDGSQVAGVVGVVAAIGLLEFQEYRAPGPVPMALGAALAGGALLVVAEAGEPMPVALALAAVAGWAHARRIHPLPAVATDVFVHWMAVLAVVASTGAAALWIAERGTTAYLGVGVLALLLTALVRGLRPSDHVLTWWLFWSAGALGLAAATSTVIEPWPAAATLALVAAALVVAVVSSRARAWLATAAVAGSAWFALVALDVAVAPRLTTITAVAALATAALTWRDGTPAHIAAASWTVATIAVAMSDPGWWLFAVLVMWVVAAVSVTVAGELRSAGVGGLIRAFSTSQGIGAMGAAVPPVLLVGGIAGALVAGLDASGLIERDLPMVSVAFGVLGLVEAASTRVYPRRTPIREVVAVAAYGAALVAIGGGTQEPGPSAAAMGLALATVAAITPAVRWTPVVWVAWAVSFGFVARAGEAMGVATTDVPLILGAWATLLAVGGLILDDVQTGRRAVGMVQVRDARLRAPVLYGVVVLPVAMIAALPGSDVRIAVVSGTAALAIAAVAVLLRLGAVTLGSYLFLTVGAVAITPRDPIDEPWVAVAWAAALLIAALAVRPVSNGLPPVARWDLPAAAVAAGALCVAIAIAPLVDEIVATYLAAGALILVTGLVLRSMPGIGLGAALLVIAGVDAGSGWGALALALAAVGVAVPAAIVRLETGPRIAAQTAAAALFVGALVEARDALGASWFALAIVCAAAGALGIIGATFVWRGRPGNVIATQLATLGVGLVGLAWMAADRALPSHEPMAAVLFAAAIGVAVPAIALPLDPFLRTWSQMFAAALFVGAGYQTGEAIAATWSEMATVSLAVAVVLAVSFALLWLWRPGNAIAAQLGLLALAAESLAVIAAWQVWPDHQPMAAVALVAAIQAVAASVALRDVRITTLAPPLISVAWLLLAGDLLADSVMWWAAPIGLAALVVVAIARADRRRRDLPIATPQLVVLECAGMAVILVPPLVETVTISPVRGLIGIGFGLAIVGWGMLSRVRRRLFIGAGGIVAIVLVMILGQVADLIPRIQGPTLWAVIVAAGFVLIVIATSIERGRTRAAEAIAKLNELLDGWE